MNKRDLRIVYMGTPDFAVLPLQRLVENGFHIVGVVTNPDKPAGRGQQLQESAVKKYALAAGLDILQPDKFRDPAFLEALAAWKADLQLVVAFKMLPEVVWNMPPLGTVNLHASLLPDYRGAAPINWALMNGESFSGVTTFQLRHEIDTGNIIGQERIPLGPDMTAGELHDELMERGADLLVSTVESIAAGNCSFVEQDGLLAGRPAKQAPKIFKEDMKIRWNAGVREIHDHVRGLSPFPAAWTELRHKETGKVSGLKVFRTEIVEEGTSGGPGLLRTDGRTYLEAGAGDGWLRIHELQLAGKRRMGVEEFLRGFHIKDYSLKMD